MDLNSIRLTWVLVFELCVLTPIVSSQIQGCSMEGIDILQCLNQQDSSSFTDSCCKALRLVVQAGYNCLCSLLSPPSINPLLSTPFSLPLSNCDIYVPPLILCRAPMPVVFPVPPTAAATASPKEVSPAGPPPHLSLPPPPPPLPSPPPHEMPVTSNLTRKDNSTMVAATQPHSNANAVPDNDQSSNGNFVTDLSSSMLCFISLILCFQLF